MQRTEIRMKQKRLITGESGSHPDIRSTGGQGVEGKWAMLTSYDATSARNFDLAEIHCILVGDSAAQVVFVRKSTLSITMGEMIPLVKAVATSCERALVIADMPFGSYQESPQVTLRNAARFMKKSLAHGVKLEGDHRHEEHVKLLTQAGIPVMAHTGFTPQHEHAMSGFKVQGRQDSDRDLILNSATRLWGAGAVACVFELVPADLGKTLAATIGIPVIGIGAGPNTDAQVLVWSDMAGLTPPKGKAVGYLGEASENNGGNSNEPKSRLELIRVPKFVRRHGHMSEVLYDAVVAYSKDVQAGNYPAV